jgi:ABC-type multidrug transport system ATPase subunit
MKILAEHVEKKFRQELVINNFNYTFEAGNSYALTGPNGSGKSTLLKILSQYSLPTQGTIEFIQNELTIPSDEAFRYTSFAAPYTELIEEFSPIELIDFLRKSHFLPEQFDIEAFEAYAELKTSRTKLIKNFSSGMRQKVKLSLAMASQRPILFLDEPTSNLDGKAKAWFERTLKTQQNKLIILASNEPEEIKQCNHTLSILDFK